MIRTVALAMILALSSFSGNQTMKKVIDLLIQEKSGETVEFPFLYKNLSEGIPEKSTLKTATYLESLGFEQIQGGRGNYPPRSPRIISKTYRKDDCECEASLIYYSTTTDNFYEKAERVKCY